jgi:D-alanyl-D-alanine carboxypeptidase
MAAAGLVMGRVRRAWAACIAMLLATAVVQPALAAGRPRYAAIMIDARSGEVLYANAADESRHPASITKVMTLFLAFDALTSGQLKLSDPVVISRHAASQRPSRLGLAPGRSLRLEDAIRIITVKSANDVAVALAERISGSERAFASAMTRKARALGMSNTVFTNASGLPDPGNVTTARDIATLSAALVRTYPGYYSYFGQRAFRYDQRDFTNHNHLLGKLTGMDGIKTGYTADAGFTLTASTLRNGERLIVVVLGEPSLAARNRDVTALTDAGFAMLQRRRAGEATTVAANMPTLRHPALRMSSGGYQVSRAPVVARSSRTARAPQARQDAERRDEASAKASGSAKRGASASTAKPSKRDKAQSAAKARATRSADKGDADKAKNAAGATARKSRSETKAAQRTKAAKADASASAKPKAGTIADGRRRPGSAGDSASGKGS